MRANQPARFRPPAALAAPPNPWTDSLFKMQDLFMGAKPFQDFPPDFAINGIVRAADAVR